MTRAVEVAPGCYVQNVDDVVAVHASEGPQRGTVVVFSSGVAFCVDAAPEKVAAKLWPGDVATKSADQVRHQVSLALERALLDRYHRHISPADFVAVIRNLMTALQDEVIRGGDQ